MCDPVSLGVAGLGMAAISTGVGVMGSIQQAQAQNRAADYNTAIQRNNALAAQYEAQDIQARGAIEEKQHRLKVAQQAGAQRAASAASGVLVDAGSTANIVDDTVGFGELDALTIRQNAARQAWGAMNQSRNYSAQANLASMNKQNVGLAATSSLVGGASAMLQQGSQLYSATRPATPTTVNNYYRS